MSLHRLRTSIYYRRRFIAVLSLGGGLLNLLFVCLVRDGFSALKIALLMILWAAFSVRSAYQSLAVTSLILNLIIVLGIVFFSLSRVLH